MSDIIDTNQFQEFPKLARYSRDIVITEKIDGTNAQIAISESGVGAENAITKVPDGNGGNLWIFAGSRNRWLTLANDNYGFARWVLENATELIKLGPGRHFGEWWGSGIQRAYGLVNGDKRFSLFNVGRWCDWDKTPVGKQCHPPKCCHVVPTLAICENDLKDIELTLNVLATFGSVAAPGFMNPEGIVIYHTAGGHTYKKTIKDDESPKSLVKPS